MEIRVKEKNNHIMLTPVGDLDANSSMNMDETIQSFIDKGVVNFHIDCSELKYISSAGLGVFISFMDILSEKEGKFVFSEMSPNILKVFQLLGLEQFIKIMASKEEAEKEF